MLKTNGVYFLCLLIHLLFLRKETKEKKRKTAKGVNFQDVCRVGQREVAEKETFDPASLSFDL